MAADVLLTERNTSGGVITTKVHWNGASLVGDILPIRFKTTDDALVNDDTPLYKPGSTVRSYEKWLRLRTGSTGPIVQIATPTVYAKVLNLGSGMTLYARRAGTFATPAVPANDASGTNFSTYTSASPLALDSVNAGPYAIGANTDFGDYLVLWLTVTSSVLAPQRPGPAVSLAFSYVET